jgi:hypothetical protein
LSFLSKNLRELFWLEKLPSAALDFPLGRKDFAQAPHPCPQDRVVIAILMERKTAPTVRAPGSIFFPMWNV